MFDDDIRYDQPSAKQTKPRAGTETEVETRQAFPHLPRWAEVQHTRSDWLCGRTILDPGSLEWI